MNLEGVEERQTPSKSILELAVDAAATTQSAVDGDPVSTFIGIYDISH